MTNCKQLCAELVRIADALDSTTPLAANQGQALDGYAALAAFRDVANRARAELAKPEPELQPIPLEPVPLSERPWERKEWCDEQGRCWWFDSVDPGWVFDTPETCQHWSSFVLPAHALPLPTHD